MLGLCGNDVSKYGFPRVGISRRNLLYMYIVQHVAHNGNVRHSVRLLDAKDLLWDFEFKTGTQAQLFMHTFW